MTFMHGKQFPISFLTKLVSGLFFIIILNLRKIPQIKLVYFNPQFYQELVSFWESVSEKQPSCISELLDNVFGIILTY